MNNANLINSLRSSRTDWDNRDQVQRQEDKEAMHSLAQNQGLTVFLRWLEWQKAQASYPVDPTNPNWQEIALRNRGKLDLINEIANQLS